MSRARNIKPGFFKNELLVELAFEYRLLFVGLWTMADREGRLEDRPTKIRMELFPADAVDVNAGLQALHDAGFVLRYEADGKRLIQVLAWAKHQNPHVKEAKSTLPAPCLHSASPVPAPTKADTSPADSLIPDSLIPQQKQERVQPMAARSRFEDFWTAYPNKKGKQEAEKTWKRRKLDPLCNDLIAHVALMQAADDGWRRGFVPMGSTYLNQGRWQDVPQRPPDAGPPAGQGMGKQMQGVMALEDRINELQQRRMAGNRDQPGPAETLLLVAGSDAGG